MTHQTTLGNGLRIVHGHAATAVAYCGFMIDAGTRHEAGAFPAGLAHCVEHMLFKGTARRDSWHINQRMEAVGGELNAFTTKEDTTLYCAFLPHDFGRAVELLCDLALHATMPAHELEKEREVIVDEINSYLDTPSELIFDEFEDRLFAVHPLGRSILGTEASLRAVTPADCLRFLGAFYRPERMVFFSYGPMPFDRVVSTVRRHYAAAPTLAPMPAPTPQDGRSGPEGSPAMPEGGHIVPEDGHVVLERGTHQAHVLLGARSYPLGHPHAAALALLSNILGGPGMNSRLGLQLRERRGLVYTVESSATAFTDAGYFAIYFGCDHADVQRCLHLCRTQLRRLRDDALTPRQLLAARKQLKGQLALATANLENNAIAAAKSLMRLGRVESLADTCARIDAVTAAEMQEVADEVFADGRLLTVVIR